MTRKVLFVVFLVPLLFGASGAQGDSDPPGSDLPAGAIIGITFGVFIAISVGMFIICFCVFLCCAYQLSRISPPQQPIAFTSTTAPGAGSYPQQQQQYGGTSQTSSPQYYSAQPPPVPEEAAYPTAQAPYPPEPTDPTLTKEQPPSYSAAIAYPTADPTPSAPPY